MSSSGLRWGSVVRFGDYYGRGNGFWGGSLSIISASWNLG